MQQKLVYFPVFSTFPHLLQLLKQLQNAVKLRSVSLLNVKQGFKKDKRELKALFFIQTKRILAALCSTQAKGATQLKKRWF